MVAPLSTNIDSALGGFVGTSDAGGGNNDLLYVPAAVSGYNVDAYFSGPDWDSFWGASGSPAGFYDTSSGTYESSNPAFMPKVGQAFFLYHAVAGTETWTNIFTIQ